MHLKSVAFDVRRDETVAPRDSQVILKYQVCIQVRVRVNLVIVAPGVTPKYKLGDPLSIEKTHQCVQLRYEECMQ